MVFHFVDFPTAIGLALAAIVAVAKRWLNAIARIVGES